MDKESFMKLFLRPKIGVKFNENRFWDDSIKVDTSQKSVEDFLEFYTPWHHKDGKICRAIEIVEADTSYRTIKVGQVMNFPEKADEIRSFQNSLPNELCPIPIATDLDLMKTLVLDSNHTIVALTQVKERLKERIRVVEITGKNLSVLVPDFKILARDH